MATRLWIVVGDALAGGGAVVSGSPFTSIDGKPVARIGDKAVCQLHGPTSIASGDPTTVIDGQPVARHGDKCACGCALLSVSQVSTFMDDQPAAGGSAGAAAGALAATAIGALHGAGEAEVTHAHFNEGDDPEDPVKARDVMRASDAALLAAGAFRAYATELEAAQAWRSIVLPIANSPEFDVEVGTKITRVNGQYFLGASYSTGSKTSCDGLPEDGHQPPGTLTAYIHTHPYDRGFIGRNRAFQKGDEVDANMIGGMNKPGGDVRGDLVAAFSLGLSAYIAEPGGLIRWDYTSYLELLDQASISLSPAERHVELGAAESRH
jgi:uncharacterized Zn-binding protein involved in type VI secretion